MQIYVKDNMDNLIGTKPSQLGLPQGSLLNHSLFNIYTASLHSLLLNSVICGWLSFSPLNEQLENFKEWLSEGSLGLSVPKPPSK